MKAKSSKLPNFVVSMVRRHGNAVSYGIEIDKVAGDVTRDFDVSNPSTGDTLDGLFVQTIIYGVPNCAAIDGNKLSARISENIEMIFPEHVYDLLERKGNLTKDQKALKTVIDKEMGWTKTKEE